MAIMQDNGSFWSLEDFDQQQYDKYTVIFVAILSIIGTTGNIHTLMVYSKSLEFRKLSVRVLVIWLSATDLIACLACMPFEICDIRFDNTFSSGYACKLFRFLNHTTTMLSGAFLTMIAVQRFKITTQKYNRYHINSRFTLKVAAVIVTVICCSAASPAFKVYDVVKKETYFHGLNGTDCKLLPVYDDTTTFFAYMATMMGLSTICMIAVIALYSKILYIICFQMEKVSEMQLNERPDEGENVATVNSDGEKSFLQSKYENSRRLTITFFVATAVSYIGYIFHVLKLVIVASNPDAYKNKQLPPVLNILSRAYFLNNAVNPIVYCLLDRKFRKECSKLYGKSTIERK